MFANDGIFDGVLMAAAAVKKPLEKNRTRGDGEGAKNEICCCCCCAHGYDGGGVRKKKIYICVKSNNETIKELENDIITRIARSTYYINITYCIDTVSSTVRYNENISSFKCPPAFHPDYFFIYTYLYNNRAKRDALAKIKVNFKTIELFLRVFYIYI